jgi:hypothetical protein
LIIGTANDKSSGRRIPAANLESLVVDSARERRICNSLPFIRDESVTASALLKLHLGGSDQFDQAAAQISKATSPLMNLCIVLASQKGILGVFRTPLDRLSHFSFNFRQSRNAGKEVLFWR